MKIIGEGGEFLMLKLRDSIWSFLNYLLTKALDVCRCDYKTNAMSPVLTIHSAVLRYFKKSEVQMQSKKYVQIQRYIEKKIELKYLCVDHKKENFRCKGKIGGRERKCIKIVFKVQRFL